MAKKYSAYNGVPATQRVLDLKMPNCFLLAGADDKGGFGSKININNCTTIAYYPKTYFTDQIMRRVAQTLDLQFDTDIRGTNEQNDVLNGTQFGGLYGVVFDNVEPENSFVENMQNLSYRVYYNQTYIDNPNFYAMYGEEKFGASISMQFMMLELVSSSSFPMILHGHILSSIMLANGVVYDPIVRQNPYIGQEGQPANPLAMISAPLTGMIIIFHFLFTYITLNQDKSQGILDALRLSGVSDFVYILENFVFQFCIYMLSLVGQMWVLYGFPLRYDFFKFLDWDLMFSILFVGGIYATALALFLNFVLPAKGGITVSVIFVALFIAAMMLFLTFGEGLLYDPSVIPTAFLRGLIAVFYPFSLVANVFMGLYVKTDTRVDVNMETLEYSVIVQEEYHSKDFVSAMVTDCALKSCTYTMPAFLTLEIYILIEALAFILLAWVLGEWLPGNASACRPPWKLFRKSYFDVSDQGFTFGALDTQRTRAFQRKIDARHTRRPLTLEEARKCIAETTQKSDPTVTQAHIQLFTSEYTGDEVLVAHHLHKTFMRSYLHQQRLLQGAQHHAVKSFTLKVHSGEVLGIGGHNGSGKSTSQGLLVGAVKMDGRGYRLFKNSKRTEELVNNAWIGGHSIREEMQQVRRLLGICPQFNTTVYQDLTVYQNMAFVCQIQNIPPYDHDRIIKKMLSKIGLLAWQDKKMSQLSGGMARRVCVAIALLNPERRLALIDEGTTGLDPSTKRIIWSLIKDTARSPRKTGIMVGANIKSAKLCRVRQKRPGIIMTSHDMDELNTICDRIIIMSAGQIVAQGTALDLKRRYGSGYSLSTICPSAEASHEFVVDFLAFCSQNSDVEDAVKLVDQSGALASFSLRDDLDLSRVISYLEEAKQNSTRLQDFCLERTSMDEVFVAVGRAFEMANGGEEDQSRKKLAPEFKGSQADSIEQVSQPSLTSDASVDVELNGDTRSLGALSPEEVQRILQPAKSGRPQALRAMLYKMAHNDKLATTGIFSFIILPIVLVLIAFLLADLLIPWFIGKVNGVLTKYLKNVDALCQLCELMKAYDLPVGECNGYDSWGFQNTCQMVQVQKNQLYQYNPVWYGGDLRRNDIPSMYSTQEGPGRFIIFDKDEKLGKHTTYVDPVIARMVPGAKVVTEKDITLNATTISVSNWEYKYFASTGKLVDKALYPDITTRINQYTAGLPGNQFITNLPIKPIAIQDITRDNEKLNSFTLQTDWYIQNGYELFDNSTELDDYYMKLLRSSRLPYDGYLVEPTYRDKFSEVQPRIDKYYENNPEEMRNDPIFISMDDAVNLQHIRQQITSILPLGFMDMDHPDAKALEKQLQTNYSNMSSIYSPVFSGFAPPRLAYPYYAGMKAKIAWVPTERYNSFVQQLQNITGMTNDSIDQILTPLTKVSLQPTREPSVIGSFFLESGTVTPQTALIDMMMRSADSILKTEVDSTYNILGAVQMFPGKLVNVMDAAAGISQIVMTTLFLALATFFGMIKFGSHLVQDRQTGMRKQLYLNGVRYWDYWGANLLYSIVMSALIQAIILFFGILIFGIKVLVKIDFGLIFLISLGAVAGSVSMSSFLSVFFTKQQMYLVAIVAVLVVSMLITVFSSGGVPTEAPWYSYLLPATTYVLLLVYCAFFGFTFEQLRGTSFGFLFGWIFIESAILLVLALYFDKVLPTNGYKPEPWYYPVKRFVKLFRKMQSLEPDASRMRAETPLPFTIPEGVAINPLDGTCETLCSKHASTLQLQPYAHNVVAKTQRDKAAQHDETRMDPDVAQERIAIRDGIPHDTPVVITNLQKQFGNFLAVRDISFHVPPGSVFALLGANGAGKTTALQMIVGLTEATAGRVVLNGMDVADEDKVQEVYKYLGLCPQFDVYLPNLTVRQHLKIFAVMHGVPWGNADRVVQDLARFVHLGDVLDKNVCTLSGGQRRRQSLALAIIG